MRNHVLTILLILLLTACSLPDFQQPAAQPTAAPRGAPTAVAVALATPLPAPTIAPTPIPPTSLPTATPPPVSVNDAAEIAALGTAIQRLPRDQVELARMLAGVPDARAVARTTPLEVQVGDVQDFWVSSSANDRTYTVTAALRYAGPVVLMYVEQEITVDQTALENAAKVFEERIYPRTRTLFGSEWQPGVDGDPRITILNGRSLGGGVAGYFSSRDSVPRSVNRFSNEREMFFMNIESVDPNSTTYLDVLAHEFQHMIHWNEMRNTAIWFNEGCSTLSEDLNGFANQGFAMAYLLNPDVQLTAWSEVPGQSIAHYGASNLFMRYIYAQYAGEEGLAPLIRADAGNNPHAFVELAATIRPDIADFADLFADWATANLLDDPALADGRYTYGAGVDGVDLLPTRVIPQSLDGSEMQGTVQQFGVDYIHLPTGPITIDFTGTTSVNIVGASPQGQYAWWSGRGDNSISTLTRAVDLTGLETATLRFDTWYELETNYDYAFATISTDGGTTWQTLNGTHTTDVDPHGANYGNGFNGVSGAPGVETSSGTRGAWVTETMDLNPYAGKPALLRFWQIGDDAFNAPGILIDNISICADTDTCILEDDFETESGTWQAEGFARVDGSLLQQWELRLVRTDVTGNVIGVEPLVTDAAGQVTTSLAEGESGILIIAATTPYTTEPASYRLVKR